MRRPEASGIAILTGRLGMIAGGAYLMRNLRATEGMRWDVFHMPKGPARRATRVSWDGISIYSGSEKKELAWRFLKHVLGRDSQKLIGSSGVGVGRWVLLDYVDVVVHLFEPAWRELYDLELLWGDAPRLDWHTPSEGS